MKLTPTMLSGLARMARNYDRYGTTMAEPNENTGRALEKRGMIEAVGISGPWRRYRITPAGRAALEERGDG